MVDVQTMVFRRHSAEPRINFELGGRRFDLLYGLLAPRDRRTDIMPVT